jgi:DNA-binding beta-propeller fold protein YncE
MSSVSYDNFNGQPLANIVSDGKYVWVMDNFNGYIYYISLSTNSISRINANEIYSSISLVNIVSDGKYLWCTTRDDFNPSRRNIVRFEIINPSTSNANATKIDIDPNGLDINPIAIASNSTYIWVTKSNNTVSQFNIETSKVVKDIQVGTTPSSISVDTTYVWVANYDSNSVTQISIASGTVIRTIQVDTNPSAISSDGIYVWVANYGSNSVSQIYISTGYVVNIIPVGTKPISISSDGKYVWVANSVEGNGISRITIDGHSTGKRPGTNIQLSLDIDSPDPLSITSDGLYVWVTASNGKVYKITNPLGKYVNPAWYVTPPKPVIPNKYIDFGNPVSMNYNHTIPEVPRFMMKTLFTNNSQIFYKPGSLASGGVGTVKNNRYKSKNT